MKKLFAILLCVVMLFTLAACKKETPEDLYRAVVEKMQDGAYSATGSMVASFEMSGMTLDMDVAMDLVLDKSENAKIDMNLSLLGQAMPIAIYVMNDGETPSVYMNMMGEWSNMSDASLTEAADSAGAADLESLYQYYRFEDIETKDGVRYLMVTMTPDLFDVLLDEADAETVAIMKAAIGDGLSFELGINERDKTITSMHFDFTEFLNKLLLATGEDLDGMVISAFSGDLAFSYDEVEDIVVPEEALNAAPFQTDSAALGLAS